MDTKFLRRTAKIFARMFCEENGHRLLAKRNKFDHDVDDKERDRLGGGKWKQTRSEHILIFITHSYFRL